MKISGFFYKIYMNVRNKFLRSSQKAHSLFRVLSVTALLSASYFIGYSAVPFTEYVSTAPVSESHTLYDTENWGLSFGKTGDIPVGNATTETLSKYDAFYTGNTDDPSIYLTFDCGYENGNTPGILDTLKKHNVTAAFFVVGSYIDSEPELVRRMEKEGHIVANHTWHHPDMSQISTPESFQKELEYVENAYRNATGKDMIKYYRPPRGIYSEENLSMAKDLGYKTFFWSLAYVDWNTDDQPSPDEAFEKLLGRIHPGAIVLLHNTSDTNSQILDELIKKWEDAGYRLRPLTETEDRI